MVRPDIQAASVIQDANSFLGRKPGLFARFPARLEARYLAEREPERLAALKVANAGGCVVAALVAPVLWTLLPDVRAIVLHQFVGGVVPMAFGFAALLRTRLSFATKEAFQVLLALAMGVVFGAILRASRNSPDSYLFGGLLLLGILSAVGARLSFRATFALMAGLTVIFESSVWLLPGVSAASGAGLALMWALTAFNVLHGAWRIETEARRTYALGLLERAARENLARANEELAGLAARDALTGLANRRAWDAWVARQWERAAANAGGIGLIVIDIDFFKRLNDRYGHAGGDECLRAVARAMTESVRDASDYLARLGGEEFAVLLPGLSLATTAEIAERVRGAVESLRLPNADAEPGGIVTISCGAASLAATPATSPERLFAAADAALYAAKRSGRNCVRCDGETARAA